MYDLDNYSTDPNRYLDAPFVPSDDAVIEMMLELAGVGSKDVLYDLGAGDGRIVVAAARDRDARGIGVELDPTRIAEAMEYAGDSRVEYLVDFIEEDIFTADFSEATVVTLYLLEAVNLQLRPRLLSQLSPGTRIVSHAFGMGDWKADERLELSGISIYKWIVPAPVVGVWTWAGSDDRLYRAELQQRYQEVTGKVWIDNKEAVLQSAKLYGDTLVLKIGEDKTSLPNSFTLKFENSALQSAKQDT